MTLQNRPADTLAAPASPAMLALTPAERLDREAYGRLGAPFPRAGALLIGDGAGTIAVAYLAATGEGRSLRLWLCRSGGARAALSVANGLARELGAAEIRSQGKIPARGGFAAAFDARGYARTPSSVVFDIDVAEAAATLARLPLAPERVAGLSLDCLETGEAQVTAILESQELLDGFELAGRREAGGIALREGAGAYRGTDLLGFVLVARGEAARAREIVARWVTPATPGRALVNLLLLRHCLERAARAGITRTRFRANPARHGDTMTLARRLGARPAGEICGFVLPLEAPT